MAYAFGAIVGGKRECSDQMFENSPHNKGLEFRGHQRAHFELVAPLKIRCADKHLRHEGSGERSSLYLATPTASLTRHSGSMVNSMPVKSVKVIVIPNRSTGSAERRREQKKRWFRNGQKWRTKCEGRISVAKRRHGLNRCRYKGDNGMKRWVGLGEIADNLVNIGRTTEQKTGL
jgi:hypothetical protein